MSYQEPERSVDGERTGQVRAVKRSLTILKVLAASGDGLTLSDTASRAELAASTTHRILTTLEAERFVRFEASAGVWQIGVSAFTVGAVFARGRDVISTARPYLRRLMDITGETASIFLESGGEVVCMEQVESRHSMRAIARVGGRMKMHWSGAGKAILAHLPVGHVNAVLTEHGQPCATARTATSRDELLRRLARVRDEGMALDDEESAEGMRCVAAPVFDERGAPVAAISISGPATRLQGRKLVLLGESVQTVAKEVTRDYGGAPRALKAGTG